MSKFKKILAFALMGMSCLIFFSGCGKSNSIKLAPTNLSASTIFHNAMLELGTLSTDAINYLMQSGSSDLEKLTTLNSVAINQKQYYLYYNMVCSMDFCLAIEENSSLLQQTQKLYEFGGDGLQLTVLVNKKTGQSTYTAKLYQAYGISNIEDLENQTVIMENVFSVSKNKNLSNYGYSDKTNGVSGTFMYNKNYGKLNFSMEISNVGSEQSEDVIEFNLYNYQNGVLGGRIQKNTKISNNQETVVQEFLFKHFNKKMKLAIQKDASLYTNMENTEEGLIAVGNAGDNYGFVISNDNASDLNPSILKVNKIGRFPD